MLKERLLILVTRDRYIMKPGEYTRQQALRDSNRTLPIGNTDLVSPEIHESNTDVLAIAMIELTEDSHGPVVVAILLEDEDKMEQFFQGETPYPPLGLKFIMNPLDALDFITAYANAWIESHGILKSEIDSKSTMYMNDIRKGDTEVPEEIENEIMTIKDESFEVTYYFLHASLQILLYAYTQRLELITKAMHNTENDILN